MTQDGKGREQLCQILDQMPYPVLVSDPDGTAALVNPAFLETFGFPSADLVVGRYNVFEDPIVRELGLLDKIRAAFAGSVVLVPEVSHPLAATASEHGSEREARTYHEVTMFPILDALDTGGQVSQVVIFWKDIGDRKRAEALAAREAEVNAHMAALSSALISATSIDEISALVLEQAQQLTRSPIGYVGYVDPATGHLVCPAMSRDAWAQCRMANKGLVFERPDGLAGWVIKNRQSLLTNAPREDPRSKGVPEGHVPIERYLNVPALMNGTLVGQIAVANAARDYTEADLHLLERLAALYAMVVQRKRAEEALAESEARFRAIFDRAGIGIALFGLDKRLVEVSPTFRRMLGYGEGELPGTSFADLTHPDDRASGLALAEELLDGRRDHFHQVKRYLRKDGSPIWGRLTASIIRDAEGAPRYTLGMVQDITDHIRAAEALRESEERFRRLAENAQDVIYRIELGPRVRFSYVSPVSERIFGCTPEELYADLELLLRLTHEDDRAALLAAFCGTEGRSAATFRLRRRDGQTVWIESRHIQVRDGSGEVVAIEGIARDVTQQKHLEEELVRAHRLEMAGRVAGQVAHDFNNLLAPIIGYPELMKMQLPTDDPLQELCDRMIEAGQRIGAISADLLALGRRGAQNHQPTDLNSVVRQAIEHLRDAPETLRLRVDLAEPLRLVEASAPQLLRVVTNLLVNAREAMEDQGSVEVRTRNVRLDVPFGLRAKVPPGEYAVLEVEDSGFGIPPELIGRIFEPFFTTKTGERKRGSGLGLSIVDAIVSDHRGYLDLESRVGRGTTFRIYLPVAPEQQRPEKPRRDEEVTTVPRGSERILVVDDDPIQRDVLARLLRRQGYRVATAESGEEALAFLRRQTIDLVVLDMAMEGIDGAETYRRALEVQPGLRSIVVSGFAESARVREARSLGVASFLLKPLTGETLARAVREALDRGDGAAAARTPSGQSTARSRRSRATTAEGSRVVLAETLG